MFGIGISELVLVAIVAIVVVGPKNLPMVLRTVGRMIGQFRNVMRELRKEVGYDEVVDEVTRPLREGMSAVESDVRALAKGDKLPERPADKSAGKGAEKFAAKGAGQFAEDALSMEYPEQGADDYNALPETAKLYPESAYGDDPDAVRNEKERAWAEGVKAKVALAESKAAAQIVAKPAAVEGTVARGVGEEA